MTNVLSSAATNLVTAVVGTAAALPVANAVSTDDTLVYTAIGAAVTALVRMVYGWMTSLFGHKKSDPS